MFACDPDAAAAVISTVERAVGPSLPIFAKLSPDVTDIVDVARSVRRRRRQRAVDDQHPAGLVIDPLTLRPVLGGVTGGLSGPAIRPVAVRCVWQVHAAMPEVPDPRHGRHPHRRGRAAVPGRGRERRQCGYGDLR